MGVEGPDTSNNPWGRGDEHEKELGPEEVAKIRAKVANRKPQRIGITPIGPGKDTFAVVSDGAKLTESELAGELNALGGNVLGLLACAVPTAKPPKSGEPFLYRPDDIRFAARWVSERYPEVSFEFSENYAKNTFTYLAKLKQ